MLSVKILQLSGKPVPIDAVRHLVTAASKKSLSEAYWVSRLATLTGVPLRHFTPRALLRGPIEPDTTLKGVVTNYWKAWLLTHSTSSTETMDIKSLKQPLPRQAATNLAELYYWWQTQQLIGNARVRARFETKNFRLTEGGFAILAHKGPAQEGLESTYWGWRLTSNAGMGRRA